MDHINYITRLPSFLTRLDGIRLSLAVFFANVSAISVYLEEKNGYCGKKRLLCSPKYVNNFKVSEYAFIFMLEIVSFSRLFGRRRKEREKIMKKIKIDELSVIPFHNSLLYSYSHTHIEILE